jgi:antitoxin CcdA
MRIDYAHAVRRRQTVKKNKKQFSETGEHFRHSGRIGQPPNPGRKRAVNVTIDEEVLADARAQGINLSKVLEDELRERVKAAKVARWQEENREALDSFNRLIERAGIFGEEFRNW